MLRAALLALSLTLSAPHVSADTFEDAVSAYQSGDFDTAAKAFRKLADQGDAAAQYNLGFMYDLGQGVPQDYAEAAKWYRLAADQGNAGAQTDLGFMYEYGEGVLQNYAEAVKWYRLAAEQGNTYGQYNLGLMYENGRGLLQDNVMAHMWYNLASANDHENAGEQRDKLAARMTAKDLAKAQAMARECMKSDYKNCGD
jgi:TPR repeat protein